MAVLKNRAKMSTSTTGTGTITLGSAEDGYQTFADAGVANADVVRYVIEDGSNFEIGTGTYTSSGTTLTRTVSESSNSNNAINLSGSATVFIGATAADIELSGNMAGDISSNGHAIKLGDRTGSGANELIMGAGDDFKLYHNGATGHSLITETGSGNLQIAATNIELKAASGHALLTATYGGSVDLYYNSSKKAETTSSGLKTTGTLNVNGAYTLPTSDGSANQVLTTNGSGAVTFADAGGGGSLSGNMAGDISSNGHEIKFADSGAADQDRLTFGASDDLQIYHDGSNSYIVEGGTGDLRLQAASLVIQNTFGQSMLDVYNGGGVNLYHNTVLKAQTETAGFAVRGQLVVRDSGGGVEYRLPAADGTNGQVLTTDGSGAVTFAAAGGGGDPDLYRDNASSATTPVASGANAVAIGTGAEASAVDGIAIGKDADATGSFRSIGIGRLAQAQQNSSIALGYSVLCNAPNGNALGNSAQVFTGTGATAIGNSYSSGSEAFAAGIANNGSSYGASSANSIAMGRQSKAGNTNAVSIGTFASATGDSSYALGYQATAESWNSVCIGANSKAEQTGKIAFAAGIFAVTGDAQGGQFILRRLTTNATPKTLSTTGGNGSASNQIVANADTCITFDGTITAMQNGAQAYASWKIEGLLVNDGGTTTLANSATTVIQNSSNWGMALSADNANNALAITCTGEASHNIRWVANIRTTEVTYA